MKPEIRMPRSRFARRNDDGFAMAIVVSIVLVMFIMLAAMILPLASDVTSSQRIREVVSERQLAESVLNELFSQAAKSSDLAQSFRMIGRVNPGVTSTVDTAGLTEGWAEFEPSSGTYKTCSSVQSLCYYYSPQITAGSPFVNVEVTTRSGCRADNTSCIYRRFQQSWRRRTFVDYAVFTDMETLQPELYGAAPGLRVVRPGGGAATFMTTIDALAKCAERPVGALPTIRNGLPDTRRRQATEDFTSPEYAADHFLFPHRPGNNPATPPDEFGVPAGQQPPDRRSEDCFDIAYTGTSSGDTINGPIHTNDYFFWICGSPKFTSTVEAGGDPALSASPPAAAIFHESTGAGCTAGSTPTGDGGGAVTAARGTFLKLPDRLGTYSALATVKLQPTSGTTVKIVLNGTTMSVDQGGGPTPYPVPKRGVVYVTGAVTDTLEIEGIAADATFVTEGNLVITGDITQPANSAGVTLGFVAAGSTTIKQTPSLIPGVKGPDRIIYGSFLSLTGGMSVDGWNDPAAATLTDHPTLHLHGAVIAKYRPVFGTYDKLGELKTGMHKDIQYPRNVADTEFLPPTPPYFVQPVNAVWVRLDLSETPIQAGSPGLTLKPASGPVTAQSGCQKDWPATTDVATGAPTAYIPHCLVN
jgi:type II secretory pathway pseudopilin PulG